VILLSPDYECDISGGNYLQICPKFFQKTLGGGLRTKKGWGTGAAGVGNSLLLFRSGLLRIEDFEVGY
jgi:hypothetical protein